MAVYAVLTPTIDYEPVLVTVAHPNTSYIVNDKVAPGLKVYQFNRSFLRDAAREIAERRGWGLVSIARKNLQSHHFPMKEVQFVPDWEDTLDYTGWCEECESFKININYPDECRACQSILIHQGLESRQPTTQLEMML